MSICHQCGQTFPAQGVRKYCSDACRNQAARRIGSLAGKTRWALKRGEPVPRLEDIPMPGSVAVLEGEITMLRERLRELEAALHAATEKP
jgi:hypothetical protein